MLRASDLTRDTVVGCGWAGVSFRWYYGVGGAGGGALGDHMVRWYEPVSA